MTKLRVITATLVVVPFLLALFLAPDWLWAWLMLAICLAGLHEWGGLMGMTEQGQQRYVLVSGVVGAFLLGLRLLASERIDDIVVLALFGMAALFWTLVAPLWLRRGWPRPGIRPAAVLGWLMMFPAWITLMDLRSENTWLLLALLGIVWVSDSAAYLAGRRFGRHKLAPGISPGKTWEGAVAAGLAVALYSAMLCLFLQVSWWLVPLAVILAAYGIVGDLMESWLKRCAGVKDSGRLLPGHGGILDRIDALLPVLPVGALCLIVDSHLFF